MKSFRASRRAAPAASLVALALCLAGAPAGTAQSPSAGADDQLTLSSSLVSIDVMVKDKKGNFVTDLRPEDFTITENGVRQRVEFFDPPAGSGAPSVGVASGSAAAPAGAPPSGGTRPAASPIAPDDPRHVISLLLDAQTTAPTDVKQVADGTLAYIRDKVGDADAVAVFTVGPGLRLLQPFTSDKSKLVAAVKNGFVFGAPTASERASVSESVAGSASALKAAGGSATTTADPGVTSQAGAGRQRAAIAAARSLERFRLLEAQLGMQQSRPVLAAVAAICDAQRSIPGKKILVLFSEGFVTASTQDWQVQSVVDAANRANVAVYIIDSGGLAAAAPQNGGFVASGPLDSVSGAAGQESRIRAVGGETVFDHVRHEGVDREQEILFRISGDTGGAFIKNTNDIGKALSRVDGEVRGRYTLGYYATDPALDGAFRRVKIEVSRPGVEVAARPGYYALPPDEAVPLSPDEKTLFAGFDAAAARPGLPLSAELNPFRSGDGRYLVPLSVEIPPEAVKVDRKGDARNMKLVLIGLVRDASSKVIARLGGSFAINLDKTRYETIAANQLYFRQDVELDAGSYSVDLMVRDDLSGKTAAWRERLELPAVGEGLATSGVVLSRLVIPADPKGAAASPPDVLTAKGAQIRPSPSRSFRPTDNLIVFYDLYGASAPRVAATLTLLKDGAEVKRVAYTLADVTPDPVPHLTFAKFVSLAGFGAGKYVARVEAKDPTSGAVVTHDEPFVVAP